MKAWERLKHLQEGKRLRHKTWKEDQWVSLACDIHGDLGLDYWDGSGGSIADILDIDDDSGWLIYQEEDAVDIYRRKLQSVMKSDSSVSTKKSELAYLLQDMAVEFTIPLFPNQIFVEQNEKVMSVFNDVVQASVRLKEISGGDFI